MFKRLGFDAVMFHDDDIVPQIEEKSWPQIEREAGEIPADGVVELRLVLLGRPLAEARREVVPEVGEDLRACLDEVLVVAVELFRLVPLGVVVLGLCCLDLAEQVGLLAPEELELALDHVGVALAAKHEPRLVAPWRSSSAPGTSSTGTPSRPSAAASSRRRCGSRPPTGPTSSVCRSCPSGRWRGSRAGATCGRSGRLRRGRCFAAPSSAAPSPT